MTPDDGQAPQAESCVPGNRPVQVWVLSEGHVGMENQALGLAEALGAEIVVKRVKVRLPWDLLPGRLWPFPLAAPARGADALDPPWPELVVSCGNVAAPLAAAMRRRSRGRTRAVHIQNPKMSLAAFDAVVAPRHDGLSGPNVVVTRTAVHRVTPARLAAAVAAWTERFAALKRPLVAVLVGGANRRHTLDAEVGARLAMDLVTMMQVDDVGLALTPSRRTDRAVVQQLAATLRPLGGFVWDGQGDNPYFGLLALADAIVVTEDSVSMLSEAVATKAPVLIVKLPGYSKRLGRFVAMLVEEKRAEIFAARYRNWPVSPLDDTEAAAAAVRKLLRI